MSRITYLLFCFCSVIIFTATFCTSAFAATPRFKVLVVATENTSDSHYAMVEAGKTFLYALAADSNFSITWVQNPNGFTDAYLADYKLILQLNYPPFGWNSTSQTAFQNYMEQGKGGWIGIHHPGIYSQSTAGSQQLFTWFQPFFGGITYLGYIASRCQGTITSEDTTHPCFKGVPKTFIMKDEEWFYWDKSPRPSVHMLATVNEKTFVPDSASFNKMPNDHPVAWSNENAKYKARNIYISVGHSAQAFANSAFTTIVRNAIFWAAATGTTSTSTTVEKGFKPSIILNLSARSISVSVQNVNSFDVFISNVQGQIVKRAHTVHGSIAFDRKELKAGLYTVMTGNAGKTLSQKLLIN